jgi:membrane AbrB-like protein
MSESLGADARLVAIMQYGRVVLVVASATLVASLGNFQTHAATQPTPDGNLEDLLVQNVGNVYALTGLVAIAGMFVGLWLRLPAGALIGPMVLAIGINEAGIVHVAVPGFLASLAYALIGIYAGLLFDQESLKQAWRLIPFILTSTLALMAACAALGGIFSVLTGTDYLTAYLATTPGAIDSVSIMAVDSNADSSLVLAVQMLRVLIVVAASSVLGSRSRRLLTGR